MEKEITDLFREKTFHELNEQERVQLSELCENEEEFEQMRSLFDGMEVLKAEKFTPKAETKASLDAIFAAQIRNRPVIWYNSALVMLYPKDKPVQRRPLVQIAAALVLLILTIPFLTSDRINSGTPQFAQIKKEEKKPEKILIEEPSTKSSTIDSKDLPANRKSRVRVPASTVLSEEEVISTHDVFSVSGAMIADLPVAIPSLERAEMHVTDSDFDHPDGVFSGTVISYSKSVKQQPAILDLLTATF